MTIYKLILIFTTITHDYGVSLGLVAGSTVYTPDTETVTTTRAPVDYGLFFASKKGCQNEGAKRVAEPEGPVFSDRAAMNLSQTHKATDFHCDPVEVRP